MAWTSSIRSKWSKMWSVIKDRQKFAETKKWNPFIYDWLFRCLAHFPYLNSTRVGNLLVVCSKEIISKKKCLVSFYSRWCLLFQIKWASEKISMIWKRWFEFKTIRNFLSILISSNVFISLPLGSTDSTDYADWHWDASDENRNSYFQKMNLLMWTR